MRRFTIAKRKPTEWEIRSAKFEIGSIIEPGNYQDVLVQIASAHRRLRPRTGCIANRSHGAGWDGCGAWQRRGGGFASTYRGQDLGAAGATGEKYIAFATGLQFDVLLLDPFEGGKIAVRKPRATWSAAVHGPWPSPTTSTSATR